MTRRVVWAPGGIRWSGVQPRHAHFGPSGLSEAAFLARKGFACVRGAGKFKRWDWALKRHLQRQRGTPGVSKSTQTGTHQRGRFEPAG